MFTSRAEYRTILRQDNADLRLTPLGHRLGLASDQRMNLVEQKQSQTRDLVHFFKTQSYDPSEVNPILEAKDSAPVKQSDKLAKLLARPGLGLTDFTILPLVNTFLEERALGEDVQEQTEIQIKYAGYIEKETANAEKLNRLDHIKIPDDFDYNALASLSHEAKEKLNYIKPTNLSQAARISGINPSDISVLLVRLGR